MSDLSHTWRPPEKFDSFTNDELISLLLSGPEEEDEWGGRWTLQWRGDRSVLHCAAGLIASDCAIERNLGAAILGQLGSDVRTFPRECVDLLFQMLENEADDDVIQGILSALSHQRDPRIPPVAARFRAHPNSDVRRGAIHALSGYEDPIAIDALIELTHDVEPWNRDWATFSLGTQIESDSPKIRAALFARLDDEDEVVRGEAMVGLARRKDERVVPFIARDLTGDSVDRLVFEAAELTANPALHPPLIALRDRWDDSDLDLLSAINACAPTPASTSLI